ncbi:hypothetical protein D1872_336650 [compost metagenome]
MAALRASRLVCSEMLLMVEMIWPIWPACSLRALMAVAHSPTSTTTRCMPLLAEVTY